jgi:hypothetical protein
VVQITCADARLLSFGRTSLRAHMAEPDLDRKTDGCDWTDRHSPGFRGKALRFFVEEG